MKLSEEHFLPETFFDRMFIDLSKAQFLSDLLEGTLPLNSWRLLECSSACPTNVSKFKFPVVFSLIYSTRLSLECVLKIRHISRNSQKL